LPRNRITVDGVGLSYEDNGNGHPLVFVHGIAATSFSWNWVASALSDEYRTIGFDLMGSGLSDKPADEQYTLQRQGKLLWGAIRQLGLEKPILIGHSLGGGVCLSMLRQLNGGQGEISGLVLVDTVCYHQRLPWFVSLLHVPVLPRLGMKIVPERWGYSLVGRVMYDRSTGMSPEAIEAYSAALALPGGHEALISTAKQIIPQDMAEFVASYSRISVPTRIIWGEYDRVMPIRFGRQLEQDVPSASLHLVKGSGHCPQEERPDEVTGVMREFLRAIP
jgi:pimeloyl-ACP methyl ester carboxylesterase